MSSQTGRPRYVIYLNEPCDQLDDLDNSLEKRIRHRIEKFLRAWNVKDIFEKGVTEDVDYIKKRRGETRAFGAYIELEGIHILIILAVFKQKNKSKFWLEKALYQSKAEDYREKLRKSSQNHSLTSHIENLRKQDGFLVAGPEN